MLFHSRPFFRVFSYPDVASGVLSHDVVFSGSPDMLSLSKHQVRFALWTPCESNICIALASRCFYGRAAMAFPSLVLNLAKPRGNNWIRSSATIEKSSFS
jgi:hypothetical protein